MSAPFGQDVTERVLTGSKSSVALADAVRPVHMTSDRLALIIVGAIFTSIGFTAVVLRLFTQFLRDRLLGKDDYCMALAWLSSIGMTIASYISIERGVGLELDDISSESASSAIKAVFVIEIFYFISLFFIKESLLFLFIRIVRDLRGTVYYLTYALMTIMFCHFLSTMIVVGVQCTPAYKYWQPDTPGTCIDITAFFYSVNIFTIITDVIMLALPIPTLWRLQRPVSQRFILISAFVVGFVATLASCVRLYSIGLYTHSSQPMRDAAPMNTWSFIEINLGIFCASAPAIKPLFSTYYADAQTLHSEPPRPDSRPDQRLDLRPESRLSNAATLSDTHNSAYIPDAYKDELKRPELAVTALPSYNSNRTYASADAPDTPDRAYNRTLTLAPPEPSPRPSYAATWRTSLLGGRPFSADDSRARQPWFGPSSMNDSNSSIASYYTAGGLPVVISTSLRSDEMLAVMRGRLEVAVAPSARDEMRERRLWPRNVTPREEVEDKLAALGFVMRANAALQDVEAQTF